MMQQNKFEDLFESYLQNNLSETEKKQMMEIIKEGSYDDFLKEKIHFILKNEESSEVLDKGHDDLILSYILSTTEDQTKVIRLDQEKKNKRKKIIRLVSGVAAVVLIALASTFYFKSQKIISPALQQPQIVENTAVDFSGKQLVRLPDGSTVLLNDNSTLKYDQKDFNSKTREVTLTGEAFFDIKRNEEKPFIVHTGKVQTKVLGTAFNINAFNSSDNIEVTVARGKVQVGDTEKIYGVITPNQQIKVNKSTFSFQQNNVSAAVVTEWKSNYLILDDINMQEAALLISHKYKVEIVLANDKIKNCRITASFLNDEDLDHVLKVVSSVIETEYRYNKSGAIIIDGKGCE